MKTTAILFLLSFLTFGCASTRLASSSEVTTPQRGDVVVQGAVVKAVVSGPLAFHAYAAFSGGTLFVADAITGTDGDCERAARAATGTPLAADRIESVTVGAGKVACLTTSGARSFEMLWHAQKEAPRPLLVAGN